MICVTNNRRLPTACAVMMLTFGTCTWVSPALAADADETQPLAVAGKKLTVSVPSAWQAKQPRVRIVEHEYALPRADEDPADGRLTMMAAGGSVKANTDRWIAQFRQLDGKPETKTVEVADRQVTLLDLQGVYLDRAGPFAPATARPAYRMIGAIIPLQQGNHYFIKLYGPEKTIAKHLDQFMQMVKSIRPSS